MGRVVHKHTGQSITLKVANGEHKNSKEVFVWGAKKFIRDKIITQSASLVPYPVIYISYAPFSNFSSRSL